MAASALMTIIFNAARKAGRHLARDFGEVEQLQVSRKGPGDFVTAADHRAEQTLYDELARARHGYGFIMEERGIVEGPDKSHVWIVDPLDGTMNFMHGIPHFAISIALERESQLVSGLVFNPVTDEMFVAEKGHGAYLNDKRLRVAARRKLTEALFATGTPFLGRGDHGRFLVELAAVIETTPGVRRFGSAALDLAWTAAGRYDGFWERGLKPWDVAAGILLVREAHGSVTDLDGGASMLEGGSILAANEILHPQILKLLRESGHGQSTL
jgi:myo-inositol-1(or 4)-monophosphatase